VIVYGDRCLDIGLGAFTAGLKRRLEANAGGLAEARVRLVLAGQLQQATEDAELACAAACAELTALAADSFVQLLQARAKPNVFRRAMLERLDAVDRLGPAGCTVTTHTPEGFAWYGLYPDAYAQAAAEWARQMKPASPVLVLGIRSIGTTLAATVAAVLRAHALQVTCCTLRPQGHPFRRTCVLPPDLTPPTQALIVDEGPGLSGTSMVAVAEALLARGTPRDAITFFPGHAHGPGPQASAQARRWWRDTPVCCVRWEELYFAERSALRTLEDMAQTLLGEPLSGPLLDVGGGRWWQAIAPGADGPLALAPFLEQPKLLARAGSSAAVLLKFTGFALAPLPGQNLHTLAEVQAASLGRLAARGLSVAPLADAHGWLVLPWLDGRRLRAADMSAAFLHRLAAYITAVAGPPLHAAERQASFQRLRLLLETNVEALLGAAAAQIAARASARVEEEVKSSELPSYGDGRLAPHEWIKPVAEGGTVVKLDAGGHHADHTAIGPQPLWWDAAGAAVEWGLDNKTAQLLTQMLGLPIGKPASFFRAGYAAFRAAVAVFAQTASVTQSASLAANAPFPRSAAAGQAEQTRPYAAALAYYRGRLLQELENLDRQ
jgi:hypothetical protein